MEPFEGERRAFVAIVTVMSCPPTLHTRATPDNSEAFVHNTQTRSCVRLFYLTMSIISMLMNQHWDFAKKSPNQVSGKALLLIDLCVG